MKRFYLLIFLFFIKLISVAQLQLPAFTITTLDTVSANGSVGYYFMTNNTNLLILDKVGNIVYDKPVSALDFSMQHNGMMTYYNNNTHNFRFMDSTFIVVDSIGCKNGLQTDPHELQLLANGHFLMLGNEFITMDLSNYYEFTNNNSPGNAAAITKCSVIQEQDVNRNVVFEWHAKNYFSFADVDTFFLNSPYNVDWIHSNAVEMDTDGNILLSSRHLDEVTKINHSDSSIIWRMGGRQNQFTFVGSPLPYFGQHDIRRLSNGNVSLYDGGNHYTPHYSRPLEFQLDEVNKIATQKWTYVYDSTMYSTAMGNAQRLGNTNTLVDYGLITSDSVTFVVVDTAGNKMFELDGPHTYRVYNYPSLPFQLHRPNISCFDSVGVTYLDAGANHISYLWNTGATTRVIAIPHTVAHYQVFVPYGDGGFMGSELFIINDTTNLCSSTSVAVADLKRNDMEINISPNPVSSSATLYFYLPENTAISISIKDISGRLLRVITNKMEVKGAHQLVFNTSDLSAGVYFISVNQSVKKFIKL